MIRLPLDRDMTDDERRGFSMACASIAQFGALLAREPTVAGPVADVIRDSRAQARVMVATAIAFDRQLGQGALRRPSPPHRPIT
jgi:hypothetical protein